MILAEGDVPPPPPLTNGEVVCKTFLQKCFEDIHEHDDVTKIKVTCDDGTTVSVEKLLLKSRSPVLKVSYMYSTRIKLDTVSEITKLWKRFPSLFQLWKHCMESASIYGSTSSETHVLPYMAGLR